MVYIGELCAEHSFIKSMLTSLQAGGSCKWVNDSQRLLLEFFDPICAAPSQVYHIALPLSPSPWLHETYSVELSQEVRVVKGCPTEWGVCFRTVKLRYAGEAIACWKDTIAVVCLNGDITALDGITGSQTAVLSGHTRMVKSLTFSSDGTLLVSGSNDKTVKLWDVQTGGVIKTFNGHTDWVVSVSISADCTMIVSGSEDKTIRLWDIQTKGCYHVIEQKDWVDYVSFSPMDSHSFISTSGGTLCQWDINGHQINHKHDSSQVSFSLDNIQLVMCQGVVVVVQPSGGKCCLFPGGRLIAVAYGNTIYILDITSLHPNLVKTFAGHTCNITSLAFSSPSSLLSSSADELVKFWHIGDLLVDPVVTNPTSTPLPSVLIKSITLQAEDSIAISGDSNGVVSIWDLSTGHCQASFQTPAKDYYKGAGQLINGRLTFVWYVWSTPGRGNIHIWDTGKGESQTVDRYFDGIIDLRISKDISRVFCLHSEGIEARSILTGEVISKIKLNHDYQRSLIVDGLRVWVHFLGEGLQGWDFGIQGLPTVQLPTTSPLHPNNTMLQSGDKSGIQNPATGKVVFRLGGRFARPADAQWDGQYLVAGYDSGEVLILDFNHVSL